MSMFGKTNIWGKPNGYREPDWVVRQRRDARESERIRKQLERERKADERKRKAAEREREKAMRAVSRSASNSTTRGSYNSGYSSHSTNGYHSSSSFTPSSGYNSPQNASSTENGCIEAFVNFAFVAIGIAAIILPFVWDFWTLFKVVFVIGGILSISIPFIAKSNKK